MIGRGGPFAVGLLALACGGGSGEVADEPFGRPDYLSPIPPEYFLGQEAPAFRLPTLTVTEVGEDSVRLADLRGQVVALNFWNTGCTPCVAEHATLNSIAERFESKGVRYLGINNFDSPESLAREGRVAWWRRGGPIKEEALVEVIGAVLEGRRPDSPTNAAYPEEVGG